MSVCGKFLIFRIVFTSLQVVFWKWVTPSMLGLVTQTVVYHWSIEGEYTS